MLWDKKEIVSEIEPSWLTSIQHLTIYRGIEATAITTSHCDIIAVSETLNMAGKLEVAGGHLCLAEIATNSPSLTPWQIAPLLSGFSKMKYAMTPKSGERCIVSLEQALIYGWSHGKSWYCSGAQLKKYEAPIFLELEDDDSELVCYAFVNEIELELLTSQ